MDFVIYGQRIEDQDGWSYATEYQVYFEKKIDSSWIDYDLPSYCGMMVLGPYPWVDFAP